MRQEIGILAKKVINFPIYYDPSSQRIFDNKNRLLLDVRGWGWIQQERDPEKVQDDIGEFIVNSLNKSVD